MFEMKRLKNGLGFGFMDRIRNKKQEKGVWIHGEDEWVNLRS